MSAPRVWAIRARELFTPAERIENCVVLIDGERIAAVGADVKVPAGARVIEAEIAAPGFVDLQVNGAFGVDFTATPERAGEVARRLPATGVTSFLPTIISQPRERYPRALEALRSISTAPGAARSLGVHLEGPFLAVAGAHEAAALTDLRRDDLAWLTAGGVALLSFSPERCSDHSLLNHLVLNGVRLAIAHTRADAAAVEAAIDAGARLGTHVFNAMAFHHRAPGPAGALLADDRCAVSLIADGIHVDRRVVKLVARLKPPPKTVLVTDAMAAMGLPAGRFTLAGREVTSDGLSARLADGTLAGSVLTMDAAVRSFRAFSGCPTADALTAATLAPALAIGRDGELGRLAAGMRADVVLLDEALRVQQTICGGALP